MPAIQQHPASQANYSPGRQGQRPIAVVNHEMQGTLAGTIEAFGNPGHEASAHYGVGRDGEVAAFVKEADMAWANGPIRNPNSGVVPWIAAVCQQQHVNPNLLTISIEWEGANTGGSWVPVTWGGTVYHTLNAGSVKSWFVPTDAQYKAGLALIKEIMARWKIPPDRAHVTRHSDFDSVTKWFCPGEGFPLARLITDLGGHI